MALFLDTFTGTNGTGIASHTPDVGTSWTSILGAFQIQSNKAEATAVDYNLAKTNALASPNLHVEMTYTTGNPGTGGDQQAYIGVRDKNDGFSNYVNCGIVSGVNQLQIIEVISGVAFTRATASITVSNNTAYNMRVDVVGSQIDFWVNGVRASYSGLVDTTSAKTWMQIYQHGTIVTNATIDNFQINDYDLLFGWDQAPTARQRSIRRRRLTEFGDQILDSDVVVTTDAADWLPTLPLRHSRSPRRQIPSIPQAELLDALVLDTTTEWLPISPGQQSRRPRRSQDSYANQDLLGLGTGQQQREDWLPRYPDRVHPRPRLRHQSITYVDHIGNETLEDIEMLSVMTMTGVEVEGFRGYGRWRE